MHTHIKTTYVYLALDLIVVPYCASFNLNLALLSSLNLQLVTGTDWCGALVHYTHTITILPSNHYKYKNVLPENMFITYILYIFI